MPRYIRDLVDLPEQVHRGDFVLRLTEGVQHPAQTVGSYVVTPQLVQAFDNALAFIRSALQPPSSKAAYLHGSFGSGKSHFMAVLHLLLQGDERARAIPELAPVVAKHNAWTEGRRFLLVPYHMIGARSMESAILGHYAEHIRTLHPEAPVPGVFLADRIFADAVSLRQRLGDDAFFAALGSGSGGGWGALAATWDAQTFEQALASPPRAEDRVRLVGDLVSRFFTAYGDVADSMDEGYVSLDDGLSILSRHAQGLGYDAVVLFLDELILWLASHAGDLRFVNREGQKLAKLVEAQTADRPIPFVSFVARQRDLRDLVGDHVAGAQQLAFGDVLKWWEARFHTITLEDRNLPAIAERRVLKPKSAAARQELDQSFRETARVRGEVMSTLLTSTADQEMFRQVYPFSPALVQALVAVSSLLQRERTALKVMLQLLVDQRDTLKVGDVVPVGDLFDAIAQGDEAFTEGMRVYFDHAKRLYHRKLLPLLERTHDLTWEEYRALPHDDVRAEAFRADDRLIKTLLLAALVPEVEALKALTPPRLATLNHGSIRTPIPGREGQEVLRRLRSWAAQVGEIKLPEGPNPTVSLELHGVDTESIIEASRGIDNQGNRQRKIRELLFLELGIADSDGLFPVHDFTWRETSRSCEVLYTNVRELSDDMLRPRDEETWRVILDYPFDVEGYTPRSDIARLQDFAEGGGRCRTLVWIPTFLSRDGLKDLGTLVILDHILAGERFAGVSAHLSPVDRAQARSLLENQQSQLRQKFRNTLEGAYGVAPAPPGTLDESHELSEHFHTLDGWKLQPPVGVNLAEAFLHLLGQALEQQFPAHPRFETAVKPASVKKVWEVVRTAAETADGRVPVDRPVRPLVRGIAYPLNLGEMGETHFVLRDTWKQRFLQQHAGEGGPLKVSQLRRWIDLPDPRGLPEEVQNLLILTFAGQTGRSFLLHGGPYDPSIDTIVDDADLRQQALPSPQEWERAQARAAAVFGYERSPLLNAANAAKLADAVKGKAVASRAACRALVRALGEVSASFGVGGDSARATTASASSALIETLAEAPPERIVPAFAAARIATSEPAMALSITKAEQLVTLLQTASWDLFQALVNLHDDRRTAARGVRQRVAEALQADEYVTQLAPVLRAAQTDAVKLLAQVAPPPAATAPGATVSPIAAPGGPGPAAPPSAAPPSALPGGLGTTASPPGVRRVEAARAERLSPAQARELFDTLHRKLSHGPRRLTVDWVIEEDSEP